MKKILSSLLFFFPLISAFTQSGKLDSSFGTNGIVKADIGSFFRYINNSATHVLTQADGSIFIILDEPYLNSPSYISKRLPGGSIDSSYGIDGYSPSIPLDSVYAVLQPDGKMLIAGSVESDGAFYVARMNANGKPDSSFGINGMQNTPSFGPDSYATAVAVQGDGKIILVGGVGGQAFRVVRFNQNGILDSSFNGNGYATIAFPYIVYERPGPVIYYTGTPYAVAIQADGKIIVAGEAVEAGSNFAIARLNESGTLDSSFDNDGLQTVLTNSAGGVGYSLALQTDGRILLAGQSDNDTTVVARFNVDGSLDSSFNGSGMQIANLSSTKQIRNSLALQTDGSIVIAGYRSDGTYNNFVVVRFNADGTPDNSFSGDGELTTDINASDDYGGSVAIQANNKILIAGFSLIYPTPIRQHLDVLRYNPNGDLDSTFGANGILQGEIKQQGSTGFNDIVVQADGKIVVAGRTWNGTYYDIAIVRYNINGRPDSSFGINGHQITSFGTDGAAVSVRIQSDGKIILAGLVLDTATYPQNYNLALVRYNADGTLDATFSGDGKSLPVVSLNCRELELQPNGKIVLTGYASTDVWFDTVYFATARFNTDGTPDNTFSQDGIQLTSINNSPSFGTAMTFQGDGKIVVAGRIYMNGQNNFAVARYNDDGSLDSTFSDDGKQNNSFGIDHYFGETIKILNNGNILVGGFGQNDDGTHKYIAVARYKANGILDSTFNSSGFLDINLDTWVAINEDGRIAIGGRIADSSFGGVNVIQLSSIRSEVDVKSLLFSGEKLYGAGFGLYPDNLGVLAKYLVPAASAFVTSADGDWNQPSTWQGGVVPSPTAQVIVRHNVTVTADASCFSLNVESPVQ